MQEEGLQETTAITELPRTIERIFEHWKVRMGHPRARLDQKRRSKIRQRLCDRYSEQDLLDAIEGCALSSFHQGQNDRSAVFNDIELICRDAKHVDQFLKTFEKNRADKAHAIAKAKFQREEDERRDRERRERVGKTRVSGLRSV